jgi:hypothetical protein
MMNRRIVGGCVMTLVTALIMSGGCTEPPLGWDGAGRQQDLPPVAPDAQGLVDNDSGPQSLPALCAPFDVICHENRDCCSGICSSNGVCLESSSSTGPAKPVCAPPGVICQESTDCCMGSGSEGYCGTNVCGQTPSGICVPTFIRCSSTADCCFPASDGNPGQVCVPVKGGGVCGAIVPGGTGPLCVPYGVICHKDTDCCIGKCSANAMDPPQMVCDIPPT